MRGVNEGMVRGERDTWRKRDALRVLVADTSDGGVVWCNHTDFSLTYVYSFGRRMGFHGMKLGR